MISKFLEGHRRGPVMPVNELEFAYDLVDIRILVKPQLAVRAIPDHTDPQEPLEVP